MYDAVLCMADGFKPTTARQHNSGGAQKDKTGVAFFIPAEVKEKKSTGIAKSPQSEVVPGVQKKDDCTISPNKDDHSNCFHCGSNHHWSRDFEHLSKTQCQSLYAAKPGEGGEAWAKVKSKVVSVKGTSHINVATEDDADAVEDGFVFLQRKSNDPRLHDQIERKKLNTDHLCLDITSSVNQMFDASHLDDVKRVSTILRGSCNASTNFSDNKGWHKVLFHMWFVRNSIANLLSLPQL